MKNKISFNNKILALAMICLVSILSLSFTSLVYAEPSQDIIFYPDLDALEAGATLPDEQYLEGTGFVSDGVGGLVSTTDNEYNAIYFGTPVRQFHYHVVMEPVNPGTSVVGGLSFKTFSFEEGKRMDLAITTGTIDKSILIYAFGMLLADNRNEAQGGLGGLSAFNTNDPITIDLYGDRNYYAVFINGVLVIETILPLEGTGVFGIRSQNSLVRYSDIYIEELGSTLLDDSARYYPETFETITLSADDTSFLRHEPISVYANLEPEGKDYDDVKWFIDDQLVIGETSLTFAINLGVAGTHEISCIVDRQKATLVVTVEDEDYIVTTIPTTTMTTTTVATTTIVTTTTELDPTPSETDFPVFLVAGLSTGVIGIVALAYFLILKKKK